MGTASQPTEKVPPVAGRHIDRKVRIGALRFETPMMFTMPIDLLYNLVSSIAESAQDGEL